MYEGDTLGKSGTDGTHGGLLRSEEFGRFETSTINFRLIRERSGTIESGA